MSDVDNNNGHDHDHNDDIPTDPVMRKRFFKDKIDLAWISLFAIIAETIYALGFITPEKLTFYDNILSWSMSIFASIILGYLGANSYVGGKAIRNLRINNGNNSTIPE